jgi:glycerol-3-phosphate dehydrogenase
MKLAQRNKVDMPITEAMVQISCGKLEPRLAIDMLMRRAARRE